MSANKFTFEQMVISGVTQKLKDFFNLTQTPSFLASTDRWRLSERLNKNNDKVNQLQLPILLVKLVSLELDTSRFSTQSLAKTGIYSQPVAGSDVVTRYQLVPAIYTFELLHLTQDFYDSLSFSRRYILANRVNKERLNFTLVYDGIDIDIRAMVDESISVPERDASLDTPSLFELTSSLRVYAYCAQDSSETSEIPVIKYRNYQAVITTGDPIA